jgi:hypothetical protein
MNNVINVNANTHESWRPFKKKAIGMIINVSNKYIAPKREKLYKKEKLWLMLPISLKNKNKINI